MIKKEYYFTIFIFITIIISLSEYKLAASTTHEVSILRSSGSSTGEYLHYRNALSSIGLNIKVIGNFENISLSSDEDKVLVVPGDAACQLKKNEVTKLVKMVENGLNLVTDQHTQLAEALGIKFKKSKFPIASITDKNHPEIQIRWKQVVTAEEFEKENSEIICKEPKSGNSVLISGKLGKGRFIFSIAAFDNEKSFGYGRYPYFHESFLKIFGIKPFVKRNRLVAYLDMGYHDNDNLADLVKRMKSYGISEVHISGWYSKERFGEEYDTLINRCHENGMLAYMWLEFPMVTHDFWDSHPEWREKTALLKDAALDWRKLMAMENPECFNAVTSYLNSFIENYEWDGIDLAEFYFESLEGYKRPGEFTPMSDYVRNDFSQKYGFDPSEIFNHDSKYYYEKDKSAINKFMNYRVNLCTALNRKLLQFLKTKKEDKSLDIYLTQIANPFDEKLNRNIGVEVDDFIKLQKEFLFTMQAEDPYPLWVLGPERYKKIGNTYRGLLGKDPTLTIDINIVDEGRDNPYPTSVQTGLEFTELLSVASQYADRVCIYAVSTPYEYDFKYAPYALSSGCSVVKTASDEFKTHSKRSFIMELDSTFSEILINNKPWKCYNGNSIIIPSGDNILKVVYGKEMLMTGKLIIKDISCDIESFKDKGKAIEISYKERRNVYVTVNKKPLKIFSNNEEIKPEIIMNNDNGNYVVCCPEGNNTITLTLE